MRISPVSKKRKPKKTKKPQVFKKKNVSYVCLKCHEKEEIPFDVVRNFDLMDGGDPAFPPQFACEQCGGEMYPEYYKGIHGIEYKLSDLQESKKD